MTLAKRLDALEKLAKAATPGPWNTRDYGGRCLQDHAHGFGKCNYVVHCYGDSTTVLSRMLDEGTPWIAADHSDAIIAGQWEYETGGVKKMEDAAYIAAANPSAILALIGEVRELLKEETDG